MRDHCIDAIVHFAAESTSIGQILEPGRVRCEPTSWEPFILAKARATGI